MSNTCGVTAETLRSMSDAEALEYMIKVNRGLVEDLETHKDLVAIMRSTSQAGFREIHHMIKTNADIGAVIKYVKDGEVDKAIPATHFHLFRKLPTEIRTMIWDTAIEPYPRTPRSGLQYFTIFHTPEDNDSVLNELSILELKPRHLHLEISRYRPRTEWQLAAPRVPTNAANGTHLSHYSWFNNDSLYSANLGLHDACHESREALIKAAKAPPRLVPKDVSKSLKTMARNGNKNIRLTQHEEDLFCFQLAEGHQANAPKIDWNLMARSSPLADLIVHRWENVGFEFDPSWLEDLPGEDEPFDLHLEASPRGLFASCVMNVLKKYPQAVDHVFLIDRTLTMTDDDTAACHTSLSQPYCRKSFTDRHQTYVDVHEKQVVHPKVSRAQWMKTTSFYLVDRLWQRRKTMPGMRRVRRDDVLNILAVLPLKGSWTTLNMH